MVEAKSGFASGHNLEEGVFQFRMNNLTTDGRLDLTKRRRVPHDSKKIDSFLLQPGDVLFNATNSPELVGKSAYVAALDEPAVFSNHFVRLRPTPPLLDGRFLARWLQQQWRRGLFQARAKQWVNQATFGRDVLAVLRMPLPPIEEQRRIAAVLDQADELRAKRRASLAVTDSLTESIFLDTFGEDASQWSAVPIDALAADVPHAIRTGPFGSQLLHSEFVSEGVAVLGIDNAVQDRFEWARLRFITAEKFEQLRRYQVRPGDVLVTLMGTCGRAAVVPDDIPLAINTKHLCCITVDRQRCSPTYLWACFRFDRGLRRQLGATARGAVMPGLNQGLIKAGTVPLPPIEDQQEFERRLDSAGLLRKRASGAAQQVDDLFASLQHRAFSGAL